VAAVHHDHALGQRHGFDLVVRHEQAGDAQLAVQLLNLEPCLGTQLGVQIRQRLVKQKHLRLANDGAAHGHALALAAGQLARLALQQLGQLQNRGGLVDPDLDLGHRHFGDFQAIGHVVEYAHVRVQRVVLKHHGDVALGGFQVVDDPFTNRNGAARDVFQARHHAQQGGFAAAGGTDDDDKFTMRNLSAQVVDDSVGFVACTVGFEDVRKGNGSHEEVFIFPYQPGP
jgi:hypothetical protein